MTCYAYDQPSQKRYRNMATVAGWSFNRLFWNDKAGCLYDVTNEGAVLIYVHKELELDDVEERYSADHYVIVDDKLRILTAVKHAWGHCVTTVFPRQGHYSLDEKAIGKFLSADCTIDGIGELVTIDFQALAEGGSMRAGAAD